MQTTTNQTSLQDPSQSSFNCTAFLLTKAAEEYQRVTVDMHNQQMSNVKTYLWTANLMLTGSVFVFIHFKTYWTDVAINIIAIGLLITMLTSLAAVTLSLSCLMNGFRRPIDNFPAWEKWVKDANLSLNDPQLLESKFREGLISQYEGAIKTGTEFIHSNGLKLSFANGLMKIGIGAAFISLLIFIPHVMKGGL